MYLKKITPKKNNSITTKILTKRDFQQKNNVRKGTTTTNYKLSRNKILFFFCVIKIECVPQINRHKNKSTKFKIKTNYKIHNFLRRKLKAKKITGL